MPISQFRCSRALVLLLATVVAGHGAALSAPKPDLPAVATRIVAATNEFRRAEGRPNVAVNATLQKAAREFAAYMAEHDKYGHEADGRTPAKRTEANGYQHCIVLENIASSFSTASFTTENLSRKLSEGWKNSPGHRANMLDAAVTEIGVAIAQSDDSGTFYAVQVFGRPRSDRIAFQVRNEAAVAVRYRIGDRAHSLRPGELYRHEICRELRLAVERVEGHVDPQDGDRLVISQQGSSLQVRRAR